MQRSRGCALKDVSRGVAGLADVNDAALGAGAAKIVGHGTYYASSDREILRKLFQLHAILKELSFAQQFSLAMVTFLSIGRIRQRDIDPENSTVLSIKQRHPPDACGVYFYTRASA